MFTDILLFHLGGSTWMLQWQVWIWNQVHLVCWTVTQSRRNVSLPSLGFGRWFMADMRIQLLRDYWKWVYMIKFNVQVLQWSLFQSLVCSYQLMKESTAWSTFLRNIIVKQISDDFFNFTYCLRKIIIFCEHLWNCLQTPSSVMTWNKVLVFFKVKSKNTAGKWKIL